MALKEDEIRPQVLMEGLAAEVEADRLWLLSRYGQFSPSVCPACNSQGMASFSKKGFHYDRCAECGTAFMNPRPSEQVLHNFYSQSRTYAYWNKNIFPASEATRRARIFVPRVERVIEFCKQYDVQMGTLLEIGAGFGTFCEEVKDRNVFQRVIALEMTPDLADRSEERRVGKECA